MPMSVQRQLEAHHERLREVVAALAADELPSDPDTRREAATAPFEEAASVLGVLWSASARPVLRKAPWGVLGHNAQLGRRLVDQAAEALASRVRMTPEALEASRVLVRCFARRFRDLVDFELDPRPDRTWWSLPAPGLVEALSRGDERHAIPALPAIWPVLYWQGVRRVVGAFSARAQGPPVPTLRDDAKPLLGEVHAELTSRRRDLVPELNAWPE